MKHLILLIFLSLPYAVSAQTVTATAGDTLILHFMRPESHITGPGVEIDLYYRMYFRHIDAPWDSSFNPVSFWSSDTVGQKPLTLHLLPDTYIWVLTATNSVGESPPSFPSDTLIVLPEAIIPSRPREVYIILK